MDSLGNALEQLGETVVIKKETYKDEMVKEISFSSKIPARQSNVAQMSGVFVALSIYEREEAFKEGQNPTVRFDNEGILGNKKLLLKR